MRDAPSLVLGHIALSDRHLAQAEERVARQRQRVADAVGADNLRAVTLLNLYLQTLEELQIYRWILDEELRLCKAQE